jgi:hypothetical protein
VPVSKKRVKKKDQRKSSGPPPPKSAIQEKKKPLSRQQITIYIISALIIISMTVGFIVSGMGGGQPQPTVPEDAGQELIISTPENEESDTQEQDVAPADEVEEPSSE